MYCVKKMTEDLYWVGASQRCGIFFRSFRRCARNIRSCSYLRIIRSQLTQL